ncbi:MAG: glycogen synthase GlgA [Clostridia bacterium]|nr:glycogen synthase GlgA [Clostridia bacterium]
MKVLYVTSEALPFIASGGLGDVAGSLPQAIRKRLVGCRIVMPLYEDIPQKFRDEMKFVTSISVPVSWRRQYCGIYEARHGGVTYYLLDNQYYFKRQGLYGYYDDAERFAFLSRAALEVITAVDYHPDVIHCNDWQTALVPIYYRLFYQDQEGYEDIKTLFTIHNIQYQGIYNMDILGDVFGIPWEAKGLVEFDGAINLMKGAMEACDRISTVSPTYAEEILDPWFAHGLDGMLRKNRDKLSGILNGIDTDNYNPEKDGLIYRNFSPQDYSGKAENKRLLQERLGLPQNPDVPLIAMVTRLVSHKGLDLVKHVFEEIIQGDVQFVLLGSGDWMYESFFREMQEKYPGKLAVTLGFIPELAHKIYAGADIFLMPSQSEPCGLAQMVSLRYGTIPIVRETGGLKDSVQDCGDGEGNGFTFQTYNAHDMLNAVRRAIQTYSRRDEWKVLIERALNSDFSWGRSANEYIKLYRLITKV